MIVYETVSLILFKKYASKDFVFPGDKKRILIGRPGLVSECSGKHKLISHAFRLQLLCYCNKIGG
jgi:hypothetical protein